MELIKEEIKVCGYLISGELRGGECVERKGSAGGGEVATVGERGWKGSIAIRTSFFQAAMMDALHDTTPSMKNHGGYSSSCGLPPLPVQYDQAEEIPPLSKSTLTLLPRQKAWKKRPQKKKRGS